MQISKSGRLLVLCSILFGSIGVAQHPTKIPAWKGEPSSFLGIKLGSPLTESIPLCPPYSQSWVDFQKPCAESIAYFFAIHNVPDFFDINVELVDGNVGSIFVAFHQDSFDQISAALVEKYGPPRSRTVEDVVSKIGVHYKNYKARWVGRRLSLLCESVGTQVDQGSIHIFTSEYQNQMRSKDEDRTEQLKKRF
jgi:hypothetical protein